MSNNIIKHKRSTVPGLIPGTGSIEQAELAINIADGKLYTKNNNNSIINLGVTSISGSYITPNSGNFFSSLQVNSTGVSLSGHSHTSSDITNFNSSVSGLLVPYQLSLTNPVTGVGTSGYLTKWISSSGVSSGIIYDNGSRIGIGTSAPSGQLHIIGTGIFSSIGIGLNNPSGSLQVNGLITSNSGNFTNSLQLNNSVVALYDTSVLTLGTLSGTNAINCGQDRQVQTLTLNGTATTFTKGTGWPTSNNVARETTLNIYSSGNTSITWTIVNDWYRQPDSPLPSGNHIVLLRSVGSGTMQGHYIGNKTNN